MARLCPVCGKVMSGTVCPRCGNGRSASRRTPEQERERKDKNPWRRHYGSKAYKEACQKVLERYDGCCAVTGERIAVKVKGRWRMLPGKGGMHHVLALSEGGTDSPDNLVPLSVRAHNRIDAARRRENRA